MVMNKLLKYIFLIAGIYFINIFSTVAQLNVTFRSQLSYPGKTLANIWTYVDASGNEYALVGTSAGLSIVDITNPVAPVELFLVPGNISSWKEVKTWSTYAYVTTEATSPNLGIQIIDLSNLPSSINSKFWRGSGTIANTLNKAHALHIEAGYLYLFGTNLFNGAGLVVDLADPWNPVFMGNTLWTGATASSYIHDGYVRNDTLYAGYIYGGYFSVINVANKSNPQTIVNQNTPTNFTHNTWLTDQSRVLLTTDENSNSFLAAYDVSDPSNITLLDKTHSQNPLSGSIVHNTHVRNDYAVSSWYRDGITIVDASRPDNLITTGWYDTSPLSGNGFNGAWGVCPFLPSGNIVVSDIENGLFVLTPTYVRGCYLEGLVSDSITNAPLNGVQVSILSTAENTNTNFTGLYKTGLAQAGSYSVQFVKAGYATKVINNVSLSNGNVTVLNVKLEPLTAITISGLVSNVINGNPVANASVKIKNNLLTYTATTNISGLFSITNFYPGNYDVTAGKWSFNNYCINTDINLSNSNLLCKVLPGYYDDFTLNLGWTESGNATSGKWVRAVPVGTSFSNTNDCNPGADANGDCADMCFVTGNGGGTYSFDDIDNGNTVLSSPVFDASTMGDPFVYYTRWFFNTSNGNDSLIVRINNGSTTAILEVVTKSSSGMSSWQNKSFRIANYIAPSNNMRITVEANDWPSGGGHVVEAGFDFFYVFDQQPLPLTLLSFEGTQMGESNLLNWQSADEINLAGYEIQRSENKNDFTPIGFIKAQAQSSLINEYAFTDNSIANRIYYYRLKMIDFDGQFEYSPVIAVRESATDDIQIFPNPTQDYFELITPDWDQEQTLSIRNIHGQIVLQQILPAQQYSRIDISSLSAGCYSIHLSESHSISRLIVNKR